jgi:hypothetical protein
MLTTDSRMHMRQSMADTTPASHTSYLITLLLTLLITTSVTGQSNYELPATKKLTTADFKGEPDESVIYLAQTTPVISMRYSAPMNCSETGKVKIKTETGVSVSEKSWIKLSKLKNTELLNDLLSHEQGHYDMGVIFSIELKKTLSGICFDKNRYKQQVDSVFKSMYARYDTLQREYDNDTDHMRNIKMQMQWKKKIAAMWKNIQ